MEAYPDYSYFVDESDSDYDEEYNEFEVEEATKQDLSIADLLSHFNSFIQIPQDPIKDDVLEAWGDNTEESSISFDCSMSPNENQQEIVQKWKNSHCAICYDDMTEPCVLECGHFFCLSCLKQFLEVAMDSGTTNRIACPDLSCGRSLSNFDIRCILPVSDYSRYNNISSSSYTKRKKDEVWCPRLDCSGCAKNLPDEQWLRCTSCLNNFCVKCRYPAHQGSSCSKTKKKLKKDLKKKGSQKSLSQHEKSTKKWAAKNTKLCPRCAEVIQKNGGCHHVNCTTCGHQFCWLCKGAVDGPFHCRGKKVAVIVGSVLLSPVLVIGGAVAGGAYLVESRVIRRGSDKKACTTYEPVKKLSNKIRMKVYWLID